MTKLHLGCGERYVEGYLNIDFPISAHTIQKNNIADLFADITNLSYENGSIDEIRSHHLFEHFERPVALALLCSWSKWIRSGGLLRIETPDLLASSKDLNSFWISEKKRQQIIRHLFGSNEAPWAVHYDGWYGKKFQNILGGLGFIKVEIKKTKYQALRNIEVFATRNHVTFSDFDYETVVREILLDSLITVKGVIPDSEKLMLEAWMAKWRDQFSINLTRIN